MSLTKKFVHWFACRRFGLGYKLTLVKAGEAFDPEHLTKLVLSHVLKAETLSTAGGEISFRLPREYSSNFPALFRELEQGREAMGIGGYGVSITSLEEVFLSLEKEGKLADAGDYCRESSGIQDRIQDNGRQHPSNDDVGANGGAVSSGGRRDRGGQLRQRRSAGRDSGVSNGHSSVNGKQWRTETSDQVREIEMHSITAPPKVTEDQKSTEVAPTARNSAVANGDDVDSARNNRAPDRDRVSTNGHVNGRVDPFAHDEEDRAALLAEAQEEDSPLPLPSDAKEREREQGTRGRGRAAAAGVPGGNGGVAEGGATGAGFWEQLCWLLWKRKVVAMRDWQGGLYQVVLPAALVGLVLLLLTIDVGLAGPSLAMSAGMFGSTQVGDWGLCLWGLGGLGVWGLGG